MVEGFCLNAHCNKSISVTILASSAWRTPGRVVPCLTGRTAARGLWPRAAAHDKVTAKLREFWCLFKKKSTCAGRRTEKWRNESQLSQVAVLPSCGCTLNTRKKCKISRSLVDTLRRAADRGSSPFATARPWGGSSFHKALRSLVVRKT